MPHQKPSKKTQLKLRSRQQAKPDFTAYAPYVFVHMKMYTLILYTKNLLYYNCILKMRILIVFKNNRKTQTFLYKKKKKTAKNEYSTVCFHFQASTVKIPRVFFDRFAISRQWCFICFKIKISKVYNIFLLLFISILIR